MFRCYCIWIPLMFMGTVSIAKGCVISWIGLDKSNFGNSLNPIFNRILVKLKTGFDLRSLSLYPWRM